MKQKFIDNKVDECILCDALRIGKFGWKHVDKTSYDTFQRTETMDRLYCPECIDWLTDGRGYGTTHVYDSDEDPEYQRRLNK